MRLNAMAKWPMAAIVGFILAILTVVYIQSGGGLAILLALIPILIASAGIRGLYNGRIKVGSTAISAAALPYLILLMLVAGGCDSGFCAVFLVVPGAILWVVGFVAAIYCIVPNRRRDDRARRRAEVKRAIREREGHA